MSDWGGGRRRGSGPFDASLVHSRDEYLIVSEERVMVVCDDPVYVTLERWERLCHILPKISRIPFFAHFKKRRPFYMWRSQVRSKKFNLARNSLKEQLFILNQVCLEFSSRQNGTNAFKETKRSGSQLHRLRPTVPQTSADGHLEDVLSDQRHGFVSHGAQTHVHPAGLPGHPGGTAPKGIDQRPETSVLMS